MSTKPSAATHLNAYAVEEYENKEKQKKTQWSKVGVAFPHKDGAGFNIELRSFPLNGRLVALPLREEERDEEEG